MNIRRGVCPMLFVLFVARIVKPTPEETLDAEIASRLAQLPDLIDGAIKSQKATLIYQKTARETFGWTIIVGSIVDVFSDLVVNNRTLSNIGGVITVHRYGFILFYGIGFGFPYLLGIPSPHFSCGSADYLDALNLFGLSDGLGMYLRNTNLKIGDMTSLISEFDQVARMKIGCITKFQDQIVDVEEILFAHEGLIELLNLRISLEASRNPQRA